LRLDGSLNAADFGIHGLQMATQISASRLMMFYA